MHLHLSDAVFALSLAGLAVIAWLVWDTGRIWINRNATNRKDGNP